MIASQYGAPSFGKQRGRDIELGYGMVFINTDDKMEDFNTK